MSFIPGISEIKWVFGALTGGLVTGWFVTSIVEALFSDFLAQPLSRLFGRSSSQE